MWPMIIFTFPIQIVKQRVVLLDIMIQRFEDWYHGIYEAMVINERFNATEMRPKRLPFNILVKQPERSCTDSARSFGLFY